MATQAYEEENLPPLSAAFRGSIVTAFNLRQGTREKTGTAFNASQKRTRVHRKKKTTRKVVGVPKKGNG